jgi:hypothetical protein
MAPEAWSSFRGFHGPCRHLSKSCPCTPPSHRAGGIFRYNFHGNMTCPYVHIELFNLGVGKHCNHASFLSVDRTIVRSIDRRILGLNRCIDVCAEKSRHCKHSSTGKTCSIFAYVLLACIEGHALLKHEASQSNYCACLSAAGNGAEFMYSEFADVEMLQFNS